MVEQAIDSLSQQSTIDKNNNKAILTTAFDGAFRFTYNSAPKYFFTFIGSDENAVYEVKKGNEIISKLTQKNDIIDTSIITTYNINEATNLSGYAYDVASQSNGIIIRGWSCPTTIVNHIYNENTNPSVFLLGGIRQLPSNFGPLSATSTRDYDDDGLKDTEEINFEASYKGGYKLIEFKSDGTATLPTYTECLTFFGDDKFYVEKGFERFLSSEEYLTFDETTRILPILSDPINPDGDGDYFTDYYEYINDLNPLTYDESVIEDNVIDDTYCITSDILSKKINDPYCVATLERKIIDKGQYKDFNEIEYQKYVLSFERYTKTSSCNKNDEFVIMPEGSSDYNITISKTNGNYIPQVKVFYQLTEQKKYLIEECSEMTLNENGDYVFHYALLNSSTYYVDVEYITTQQLPYTFAIEQDNWVFAPNGALWEADAKYSSPFINIKYINLATLMKDYDSRPVYVYFAIDSTSSEYIYEQLKSENPAILSDAGNVVTIIGVVALLVPVVGPTIGIVATLAGGAIVIISCTLETESNNNMLNDLICSETPFIVGKTINESRTVWSEGDPSGYINKYYDQSDRGRITIQNN